MARDAPFVIDGQSRDAAPEPPALAPLFPVAIGLIAGIALQHARSAPRWVYLPVFAASASWVLLRRPSGIASSLLVVVAALAAGATWSQTRSLTTTVSPLASLATVFGRIVRVQGQVVSPPQTLPVPDQPFAAWNRAATRTAFLLDVETIEGVTSPVPATGRIRVVVGQEHSRIRENDVVVAFGRLHALSPPRNPGAFDWAEYQRKQGVAATLRCEQRLNVRVVDGPTGGFARTAIVAIRTHVRGWLTDDLTTGAPDDVGLLEALVLGHRATIDRKLNDAFLRTGCGHFLAASGTNVAILCSFVWALSRLLRLTNRGMLWLMIAAITINAVVADPRPPILRATVMGLLLCFSYLTGRPAVHLNTLSLAAVVLLLWDPRMLFDAGFQLSFAAVIGVVYLAPSMLRAGTALRAWIDVLRRSPLATQDRWLIRQVRCDRLQPSSARWRLYYGVGDGLALAAATAFAAWLATLPIGLHYFRQFQPWGPINTLLIFPTVCVSTWMGYAKTVVAAFFPTAAGLLAGPLQAMEDLLRWMVDRLAQLPWSSVPVPTPPWWWMAGFASLLLLFLAWFRPCRARENDRGGDIAPFNRRLPPPAPRWLPVASLLTMAGVALGPSLWIRPDKPAPELRLTVLSVGTGLAVALELPAGGVVLYDAGSASAHDIGRGVVAPFLRERNLRAVDRIYLSHADLHHFSGVPTIIDEFGCSTVLANPMFDSSRSNRPTEQLRKLLTDKACPVQTLDPRVRRWQVGGADFELLWPAVDEREPYPEGNESSTVLRVSFAGRSVLLTGDISEVAQERLLERGDLRADVLVLPGQGGVPKTLKEFVAAVRPGAVILSSGQRRKKQPDPLVEATLPARLYNTADVGAVQAIFAAGRMEVTTPCHQPSSGD